MKNGKGSKSCTLEPSSVLKCKIMAQFARLHGLSRKITTTTRSGRSPKDWEWERRQQRSCGVWLWIKWWKNPQSRWDSGRQGVARPQLESCLLCEAGAWQELTLTHYLISPEKASGSELAGKKESGDLQFIASLGGCCTYLKIHK